MRLLSALLPVALAGCVAAPTVDLAGDVIGPIYLSPALLQHTCQSSSTIGCMTCGDRQCVIYLPREAPPAPKPVKPEERTI